ncbi:hypothetical protein H6G81_23715 [Scytonema hofmannii FACHB-248]|uniref:Uncharacterized protein n=1 Tax=Scytonema hofmannii FACHB-248 TaxID=1842502 RepID=A0ABR8GVD1_9CYAN|nr:MULTISPECIES: hypothetical protein [Nostocales]MBD2607451.1 hypothetical protein [Scytonema hofmannii FACHB-248]
MNANANNKKKYWERKKEELEILSEYSGYSYEINIDSIEKIIESKNMLKSKLLGNFFSSNLTLSESNYTEKKQYHLTDLYSQEPGLTLQYKYQRFDLRLKQNNFHLLTYDLEDLPNALSTGFFVSSGMSAISVTLSALQKIVPSDTSLLMCKDSYFETTKYIQNYCQDLRVINFSENTSFNNNLLYLDSISAENQFAAFRSTSFSDLLAVILDSTCYEAGSDFIKDLVSKCLTEQVPCILLRSHTKLDSLALEYSRLGSIVFVLPPQLKSSSINFIKALIFHITSLIAMTGTNFSPHALFPLAHSKQLKLLNKKRIFWIRYNNRYALQQIQKDLNQNSDWRIQDYHHDLFFTIKIPHGSPQKLEKYTNEYKALLEESGLYVKNAPSFGFDFIALDTFIHMISAERVIRVALPDYCDEDIQTFVKVTSCWIKKYENSQP